MPKGDNHLILQKGKQMDMKPLALMIVITALAASQPAQLFAAAINTLVNVVQLFVH